MGIFLDSNYQLRTCLMSDVNWYQCIAMLQLLQQLNCGILLKSCFHITPLWL
uniref:Uncharacterized protein n=1 Tax=Manihot esculenta TaxID=3983 RepID=A0A2C9VCQ3_MANES